MGQCVVKITNANYSRAPKSNVRIIDTLKSVPFPKGSVFGQHLKTNENIWFLDVIFCLKAELYNSQTEQKVLIPISLKLELSFSLVLVCFQLSEIVT